MRKSLIIFIILVTAIYSYAQNGKNFIKPINKEGFEVDSILSMRGNSIVYLRAGTEFDINKNEVTFINHAKLGHIDITGQPNIKSNTPIPIPEPKHIGEAYMCNFDNNNYIQLEKAIGTIKIKNYTLGSEMKIYVKPKYSHLRAKIGEQKIIIRVHNSNEDPMAIIKVAKFSVQKTRKLSLARINKFTGTATYDINNYQKIPFKAEKYGTSSFLITLDLKESGEYCISLNTPNNIGKRLTLACFGV